MVIGRIKGGLGNFLFQIAAGVSLALDNNTKFVVDRSKIWHAHSHINLYVNNIFRKLEYDSIPHSIYYSYDSLYYREIPYTENMIIDGYFQSEKYFLSNKDKIMDFFSIDEDTENYIKSKYQNIITDEKTCSIHVRRGNYLGIDVYNKLDMNYYNQAIDLVGRDKNYIVFSNDIEWCKENFVNMNVQFIENEVDYVDLYLMSMCRDNIIANSTFSWWAAFLNRNENKKVITPKIWFVHSIPNEDVLPDNWIKI